MTRIESLNHAAQSWLPFVLHATWQSSLVALLILLIVWLARRIPSPLRYGLLIVALIKFAMPPMLALPTGLFSHVELPPPQAAEAPMAPTIRRPAPVPVSQPSAPPTATAAPVASRPSGAAQSPATPLSIAAILMLVHAAGTAMAMLWLAAVFAYLLLIVRRASPITRGRAFVFHNAAAEQLRLRRRVSLLVSDVRTTPMAMGVVRPAVILPRALIDSLDDDQLRAIVAHELAHHRRGDLLVNYLQLLILAAWWFNPAVWLLHRALRNVREECCDDLLLGRRLTTDQTYSDTLLRVAAELPTGPAIGASLGFAERLHPLGDRLKRIMDRTRTRPVRISVIGILAVAVVGSALLPGLAREQGPGIDVSIVDQTTAQPVPKAALSIKINQQSLDAVTDSRGRYRLALPTPLPRWVQVKANHNDFAQGGFTYQRSETMPGFPEAITIALERATAIGGIVRNERGEPIAAATVNISIWGESANFGLSQSNSMRDAVKTDDQGRWRHSRVPSKLERLRLSLSHPQYVGDANESDRSLPPVESLRDFSAVLVMADGTPLTGQVVSEQDAPIANAVVTLAPTYYVSHKHPHTRTDDQGQFQTPPVHRGPQVLTVTAKAFAPQLMELDVKASMPPLTVRLGPGHLLHGRVIDPQGQPVQGARFYARDWRGHSSVAWTAETDDQGRFAWPDAPPDRVQFHLHKEGFLYRTNLALTAGRDEQVVTMHRAIRVAGRIVDAQTSQPIQSFSIVPGSPGHWDRGNTEEGKEGRYEHVFDSERSVYQLRVEAAGYQPAESREIESGEADQPVTIDFALRPAEQIVAGRTEPPIAGAKVYAMPMDNSNLGVSNGEVRHGNHYPHTTTDAGGRFQFDRLTDPHDVVIIHDGGFGVQTSELLRAGKPVPMQQWGRIEGTLYRGSSPLPGAVVHIDGFDVNSHMLSSRIFFSLEAVTDDRGRFTFPRVPAGELLVGEKLQLAPMRVSTARWAKVQVHAGKTATVKLGGEGRTVTGRVIITDTADVQSISFNLRAERAQSGNSDQTFQFGVKAESDGSFTAFDIPPGVYCLYVNIERRNDQFSSLQSKVFTIPAGGGDTVALGDLTLNPARRFRPHETAQEPLVALHVAVDDSLKSGRWKAQLPDGPMELLAVGSTTADSAQWHTPDGTPTTGVKLLKGTWPASQRALLWRIDPAVKVRNTWGLDISTMLTFDQFSRIGDSDLWFAALRYPEHRRYANLMLDIAVASDKDRSCTLTVRNVALQPGPATLCTLFVRTNPPAPPPAELSTGIRTQLRNGVAVRFLGLVELTDAGTTWWAPDGADMTPLTGVLQADLEARGVVAVYSMHSPYPYSYMSKRPTGERF